MSFTGLVAITTQYIKLLVLLMHCIYETICNIIVNMVDQKELLWIWFRNQMSDNILNLHPTNYVQLAYAQSVGLDFPLIMDNINMFQHM
jgi:hypothetical protein